MMLLLQAGKCSGPAGTMQRLLGAMWSSSRLISTTAASATTASPDGHSSSSSPDAEVEALNKELDGLFGTEHVASSSQPSTGAPPGLSGPQRPISVHQPPSQHVMNLHEEREYDALQRQQQQRQQQQLVQHQLEQQNHLAHGAQTEPPLHPLPLKVAPAPVAPGHVVSMGLPASHIYNRRKIDLGAVDFEGRRARGAAASTSDTSESESEAEPRRRSSKRTGNERPRSAHDSNSYGSAMGGNSSDHAAAGASRLSHVNARGKAAMVDVAGKPSTVRDALASCRVLLGPEAFAQVEANKLAKGDVLTVAQLAGVMGAKQTSTLIPLCHNILLSKVDVRLRLDAPRHSVIITVSAQSVGATGVEMEALTGAAVAALTVYDMCKAVSKDAVISELMLQRKSGGKSGTYQRVTSAIDSADV